MAHRRCWKSSLPSKSRAINIVTNDHAVPKFQIFSPHTLCSVSPTVIFLRIVYAPGFKSTYILLTTCVAGENGFTPLTSRLPMST
jgi:hypothetical protein